MHTREVPFLRAAAADAHPRARPQLLAPALLDGDRVGHFAVRDAHERAVAQHAAQAVDRVGDALLAARLDVKVPLALAAEMRCTRVGVESRGWCRNGLSATVMDKHL